MRIKSMKKITSKMTSTSKNGTGRFSVALHHDGKLAKSNLTLTRSRALNHLHNPNLHPNLALARQAAARLSINKCRMILAAERYS